ncbi:hypothetical protein MMC13_004180 [Lambiella insularis]|nr:hypothetical protein [Lambiella insularis]
MKTSTCFGNTLFCDLNPTIDQTFEARASQLFELEKAKSFVDIHTQSSLHVDLQTISDKQSDSGYVSPTEPESPVDRVRDWHLEPPRYVGLPGLQLQRVSDPKVLKAFSTADRVIVASVEATGPLPLDIEQRQQLKMLEDQVIDISTVLGTTSDTINALVQKYGQCQSSKDSLRLHEELDDIQYALQDQDREVSLNRKKMEALHQKVNGTINLLSSLLDLGTGHSLKVLAEEAHAENLTMRQLTEKGTNDASTVKVLTIITLIYLPTTVVSNFFSTQFVSQKQNGESSQLVVATNAWLFAAISVPLTVLTVLIWWLWVQAYTQQTIGSSWIARIQESTNKLYIICRRNDRSATVHPDPLLDTHESQAKLSLPIVIPPQGSIHTQGRGTNTGSSTLSSGEEFESHGSPTSGEFLFPPSISYSIRCTLDNKLLPTNICGSVPTNQRESFSRIESSAGQHVNVHLGNCLETTELKFRYGSCSFVNKEGSKHVQALRSRKEWEEVANLLIKLWQSKAVKNFHLDICRDYFSLRLRPDNSFNFDEVIRTEIHKLMKPSLDGNKYIPREDLVQLMSDETVYNIIILNRSTSVKSEDKVDLTRKVQAGARILLAICIYLRLKLGFLKKLLQDGFSDQSLLLSGEQHCTDSKYDADFQSLLENQGSFAAPEFRQLGEQKKLSCYEVLPIRFYSTVMGTSLSKEKVRQAKETSRLGGGSYSRVYRVKVDPSHHSLTTDPKCDFAMKEYIDRPERVSADFDKEVKILEELRRYSSHPHLNTYYATWTQEGKYYMLLPYANCNLREYMKKHLFGPPKKENTLWLLSQFHGLAEALRCVHILTEPPEQTTSAGLAAGRPKRRSAWHHDVKPENILAFFDKPSDCTFKLADFGSGKVSQLRSGLLSLNTRSPSGTLTYEAPDATVNGGAISRKYDIWSLGCVFLELLNWAIYDYEAVERFTDERDARRFPDSKTDIIYDDGFWFMKDGSPPLRRQAVEENIHRLRDNIPKQPGEPFIGVLDLVDKMLDTNPESRIIALHLSDTLDRICKQAAIDFDQMDDDAPTGSVNSATTSIRINTSVPASPPVPSLQGSLAPTSAYSELTAAQMGPATNPHSSSPRLDVYSPNRSRSRPRGSFGDAITTPSSRPPRWQSWLPERGRNASLPRFTEEPAEDDR